MSDHASAAAAPARPSSNNNTAPKVALALVLLTMTGVSLYVATTSSFLKQHDLHEIMDMPLDVGVAVKGWKDLEKQLQVDPAVQKERSLKEKKPWRVVQTAVDGATGEVTTTDDKQEKKDSMEKTDFESQAKEAQQQQETADQQQKSKQKPLNILLLYGDDWRHDSLGSASDGLVQTPFLDRLATQGIRFLHNCVTTSVCWISRATLYTGQYVSRHKSTEPTKPEFYKGWNQTFPHLLKQAGYYFGHVGKWHFPTSFLQGKFDFQRAYYGRHWYEHKSGLQHTNKRNAKDAIEFLQKRNKDQPFFLSVCFFTPHAQDGNPEQYLPENETMSLYVKDHIPLAPSATEEAWKKMPDFFTQQNEGRNRWNWRFDTPEKHQKMMKNYYRLISGIDKACERIVKELEAQGMLDETLIIFTTDNGYFHAEHGLADKWYPYQESIRVPLIVRDPRMPKSKIGTLNQDFTLSIDLAPTILAAAGLPTPNVMHGRDFSVLYTNDNTPWRSEFFYEHPVHLKKTIIPASEALVRKDYKYMYWPNFQVEQFFDLRNDTYELNDLIKSPTHQKLIMEMRTRFEELKKLAA